MAVTDYEARLSSVDVGSLRIAIPRKATAIVTIPGEVAEDCLIQINVYQD